jgi:tryptophan-rich sensory protein
MNYKKLIGIIIVTLVIGILPSIFINMSLDTLNKPALYPSAIVFPIAWTILYVLMSIAVFMATKKENEPYTIYLVQLIVSSAWPIVFFGLNFRLIGSILIVLLIGLVITMMYQFYKQNKLSMLLLIPYLLWLFFASYLSFTIYILNR